MRLMSPTATLSDVRRELEAVAATAASPQELMTAIVRSLRDRLSVYNWVGFYMLEKDGDEDVLVLGQFAGADTPHKRIPLDRGICGAAASRGETIIVDDVHSDPRYLSCSIETKSEIVAPVFAHGRVVGELDVDSHQPAAFSSEDRALVEHCARLVGRFLEKDSDQHI